MVYNELQMPEGAALTLATCVCKTIGLQPWSMGIMSVIWQAACGQGSVGICLDVWDASHTVWRPQARRHIYVVGSACQPFSTMASNVVSSGMGNHELFNVTFGDSRAGIVDYGTGSHILFGCRCVCLGFVLALKFL